MASVQLVLTGATPVLFTPPGPVGRVLVTILSAPATVYITADGSYPILPTAGVENPTGLVTLAGVIGQQIQVPCPLFGDHMATPTLRLASAGSPVVQLDF